MLHREIIPPAIWVLLLWILQHVYQSCTTEKKRKRDIARNQNLLIFVLQWKWNSMVQHFIMSSNIKNNYNNYYCWKTTYLFSQCPLCLMTNYSNNSKWMSVACHSIVSWNLNFVQNDGAQGKRCFIVFHAFLELYTLPLLFYSNYFEKKMYSLLHHEALVY